MTGTATLIFDFERLAAHGPDAAVVVKLMMACNDMALANLSLSDWKENQPWTRRDLQVGARLYFVRMELAHLYEGIKIIPEIRRTPGLAGHLRLCDRHTQESFAAVEQYAEGGPKNGELEALVGRIRHTLTFHYYGCGKQIQRAIEDRAGRREGRFSSVTRGPSAHRWRFAAADDVVDSIVVRQIWQVPRSSDLRAAVDEMAMKVHRISLHFLDFAGEFVWRYFQH